MADTHENDPLHGITLEAILRRLVDTYGWDGLAQRVPVNCFKSDPSIGSSLKFLRTTPWARKAVEDLFVSSGLRTKDWRLRGSQGRVMVPVDTVLDPPPVPPVGRPFIMGVPFGP